MNSQNVIITDCVCDLSNDFLKEKEIQVVRFYLSLNRGRFMDGYEISQSNVMEYYAENETKILSDPPGAEEYAEIYEKALNKKQYVVHFIISSFISESLKRAEEAKKMLGEDGQRVFLVDTGTLSSGMGFLLLNAWEMNQKGCMPQEIVESSEKMLPKIQVSFVAQNADYLEINERVSPMTAKFFRFVKLRPVFAIKEGKLVVSGMEQGSRSRYIRRYIHHSLRHLDRIDGEHVFITHAGCSKDEVDRIVAEVKGVGKFQNVHVTKTSATVTCNCGEGTVGVIYKWK